MEEHAELEDGDAEDLRDSRVREVAGGIVLLGEGLDVLERVCIGVGGRVWATGSNLGPMRGMCASRDAVSMRI